MASSEEEVNDEKSVTSRRLLLKGAVGAGVGAAVWAEPSVRGFARTPAFAQSGSATCQAVNSFQWNTSANNFGWNGQPCAGSNADPYTVDPVGGSSVCAGAWGNASVTLDADPGADTVTVTVNDAASLGTGCYIVEILAIRTNGTVCESITGGPGVQVLTIDMSCVNSANKRLDIEIDCDSGLGC